jgi:hypothetical protein
MENAIHPPQMRTKIVYLFIKWEKTITFLTVFSAVWAIGSGVAWIAIRREFFIFAMLGSAACYLVGRKCWKFRD